MAATLDIYGLFFHSSIRQRVNIMTQVDALRKHRET